MRIVMFPESRQVQQLKYKGDEGSSAREIARIPGGVDTQAPRKQVEYFKMEAVNTASNPAQRTKDICQQRSLEA